MVSCSILFLPSSSFSSSDDGEFEGLELGEGGAGELVSTGASPAARGSKTGAAGELEPMPALPTLAEACAGEVPFASAVCFAIVLDKS